MAETRRKPPQDHEDLLRRYAGGERLFASALLVHPNLNGAHLEGVNLDHAHIIPGDLGGVHLEGASLRGAYLEGLELSQAHLEGANLRGANLIDARLRGAHLEGADLRAARPRGADLREADLRKADLQGADLENADLQGADLRGASLANANLGRAHLERARLDGASLVYATLGGATLDAASLEGADLEGARLERTNLTGVTLRGANLRRAVLSGALLLDMDLSPLCDSEGVVHRGPSSVDFRSIIKSAHSPNLKAFLQCTGLPEVFVEYDVSCAQSLKADIFSMLQSTFISYGSPDEAFARKLYEALRRNGVTAFFFAEHAVPGEKLHRMMRKGVNEHDRVILVCSQASLDRKGVMNEIEETLAREARDGGTAYLVPIRLDSYVFAGWKPANVDVAQAVRDRVVADFEGADADPPKFAAGVLRLIGALKK